MDLVARGSLIRTFRFEPIDSDLHESHLVHRDFTHWLKNLDSRILVRVSHEAQDGFWVKTKSTMSFEVPMKPKLFGAKFDAKALLDSVPAIPWLKSESINQSMEIEPNRKRWTAGLSCIDTGVEVIGVIRLFKPAAHALDEASLEHILQDLPRPFTLHVTLQRLSDAESQILLSRRLKQAESEDTRIGQALASATEDAIEETKLSGDALFRIEVLVELRRLSAHDLKIDLAKAEAEISALGTPYIETFGAMPSIFATFPGSWQHVTFYETGRNVPVYLPLMGHPLDASGTKSNLKVHRLSESPANIEIFGKSHLNANAVVVGASGRGKSALVGKLTQSLLQDRNVTVFKVDVGGSHSRECAFFKGRESQFSLTEPSGLNPFSVLEDVTDENARSVLANFLSVLILEKDEVSLTKSMRSQIEECVQGYTNIKSQDPSLEDFFEKSLLFPRRELLARWVKNGIYAKAFTAPTARRLRLDCQLRYFNFASIFDAADPEFAQAGMAAVLAEFNIELRRSPDRRLVLICDETPFFIQKCFEFFKFTSSNVRKYGASIVPVVQQSKHLVVGADSTLIDNAHHKFLMSLDGDYEEFQDRFQLSSHQMAQIELLRTIPREYSEFFYKFGDKGYPCRLRLTAEEYWRITTTKSEKDKIDSLMKSVPGLHLEEALRVMAAAQ